MQNKSFATRPLWFWNAKPDKKILQDVMTNCVEKDGYAGFGILPYDACKLEYMSAEYLSFYGETLKIAESLGIKMCLYDEWWFPSGSAGGILKAKYPEACAKRLDLVEFTSDTLNFDITLPSDGKIMAVTALKGEERIDIGKCVCGNRLLWQAPKKDYIVLCFILRNSGWDRVDYLSRQAVQRFIECTHAVYYKEFSEYFGNVIDSVFYDEPQFYAAQGRMWTEGFNDRFIEKYGESPAVYYPALFYDIGKDTARARNMMLSVRADMYAEGFPKVVQDWCTAHGVALTGHVDQEEVENPCGITGDLIKSFKYQDIPGIDQIAFEGRASDVYKVVSSSAVNWDKMLVMCECFGATEDLPMESIYRESLDMYTKGVNYLVPHAVWLSDKKEDVIFNHELSYRHEYFGKHLPAYNEFCSAIASRLQRSGQVNSVAVMYPIQSLQYLYTLNWEGDPYLGGPTSSKNNYLRVGQYLTRSLNCDFNFLHPERLNSCCEISDGALKLISDCHYQQYKVIILPGMKCISSSVLEKLYDFVQSGGTLIAISELPTVFCETGETTTTDEMIYKLFGIRQIGMCTHKKAHQNGGECYALPYANIGETEEILKIKTIDTAIENKVYGLQYIHKRNDAADYWLFASIYEDAETRVFLEGEFNLTAIDPETQKTAELKSKCINGKTVFDLKLDRGKAVIVEGR